MVDASLESVVGSTLPLWHIDAFWVGASIPLKASSKRAQEGCLLSFETVNLGCLNNGSRNAGTY
ncbi:MULTISPECIES: hypothetical protein, partial [unclassified Caballeronia]|uniref:hypothetical protein n=1 Tax=unclassified Caballeronia TaxID=2646786 RepID=UPI002027E3C1